MRFRCNKIKTNLLQQQINGDTHARINATTHWAAVKTAPSRVADFLE